MQQREHWGTRLGFVLATAGSAVGLGSLWRFPYVAGENGGGSFILFFILFTFIFGIPLFIAEAIIGRSTQKSSVGAYFELSKHSKNWRFVGWMGVFACLTILSFYNVVAGWSLNYALMSLNGFMDGLTQEQISSTFDVLYSSGGIKLFWHFLFMVLTVGVVWGGVRQGIEFWSRILMPALFLILIGLFIYSLTLSGFSKAFEFVFLPDWTEFNMGSMLEALGMALFTLSLGLGIILTYGSYMKPSEDIPKASITIQIVNVLTTMLASLVIFPLVFTFGQEPQSGPGLVFKVLPLLFFSMDGGFLISSIFFILMVFTALTSTISLLEVLIANIVEVFHWSRKKAAVFCGILAYLLGIPSALAGTDLLFPTWASMYGKDFLGTIASLADWQLPIGGLLASIFVGWVVDKSLLHREFCSGSKMGCFFPLWLFFVRWCIPIGIVVILLQKGQIIDVEALLK